jgi:ribosome maturation factor RimP
VVGKKGATVDKKSQTTASSRVGGGRDIYGREKALAREITPVVENGIAGIDVLAVELVSPSRFCVFVDHVEGVDHALCGRVTHLLERWRDEYSIDVSSPGPNRPLRKPGHFAHAVGNVVSLRTGKAVDGETRFRGELTAAGAGAVTITTAAGSQEIPYDAIVRANVIDETT